MLPASRGENVARDPDTLEDARREKVVVKLPRVLHHLIDVKKQLALRNVGKIRSDHRRQEPPCNPNRDGPQVVAALTDVRQFVKNDHFEQPLELCQGFGLVGKDFV